MGGREVLLGVKQGQALGAPDDGLQEAGGGGPTVGGPLHNVHHVGEPLEEAVIQHHLHVTLQLLQVHLHQDIIFRTSTLVPGAVLGIRMTGSSISSESGSGASSG